MCTNFNSLTTIDSDFECACSRINNEICSSAFCFVISNGLEIFAMYPHISVVSVVSKGVFAILERIGCFWVKFFWCKTHESCHMFISISFCVYESEKHQWLFLLLNFTCFWIFLNLNFLNSKRSCCLGGSPFAICIFNSTVSNNFQVFWNQSWLNFCHFFSFRIRMSQMLIKCRIELEFFKFWQRWHFLS